jgi:DtxR family Mn-dependent transcriptional regulator
MGQVSASLGVVPGTATTMIKTLAESGLVHYEPYLGVRLTAAGEKLAGLVIRRHRLIELFLVKILGMSWAEVHDEAERLEHAVSERLIDRIDDMLGRPVVDPHGDPIPTAEGRLPQLESVDLLSAPAKVPLVVTRVTDQDPDFLRFVEQRDLVPGRSVTIVGRDEAGGTVQLRGEGEADATIGHRAASKILVRPA